MDTERLGQSWFFNWLFRPAGASMDSDLRRRLMPPEKTLQGAGLKPGQTVLEVGCGSGFFTLPAAEMIGESGRLIAMDPLESYVKRVRRKVDEAGLKHVDVVRRDALQTRLDSASIDVVLLFGVLPFPTLPLDQLLPEMRRVLVSGGILAVWMFPVSAGVPTAIERSGLFRPLGKTKGVYKFQPIDNAGSPHPD